MEAIRTENITLQVADGTSMNAYVAMPADGAKAPGLLVFQEAFGVNGHIRDVAGRFAKKGYVAIAPELFHRTAAGFEGDYNNFPAVMPHMQALTADGMIADARAAFDWLQKNPNVLPDATACVGYCMGGAHIISGEFGVTAESGDFLLRRRPCSRAAAARCDAAWADSFFLGFARYAHPKRTCARSGRRHAGI